MSYPHPSHGHTGSHGHIVPGSVDVENYLVQGSGGIGHHHQLTASLLPLPPSVHLLHSAGANVGQLQTHDLPAPPKGRKKKTLEEIERAENLAMTRKRTPKLTINDKVKIIYLHKHELKSYSEIGEVFRCTKSTISGIIKNATEILDKASKLTETQSKQKCRVKQSSSYPEVEHSLYQWLNHQSVKSTKVSDRAIRERAREECIRLYNRDWKPSNGWLIGFKARMKRKESFQAINTNSDPNSFYGDSQIKVPNRWIEKIRDKTWAARPDNILPGTVLQLEAHAAKASEEDEEEDDDEGGASSSAAGASNNNNNTLVFENYLPQVYSSVPRQPHVPIDGRSHGLPY